MTVKKGLDLAANPYAELLFYWPELERQVRMCGRVDKISEQEFNRHTITNALVKAKLQRILVPRKVV